MLQNLLFEYDSGSGFTGGLGMEPYEPRTEFS